MRKKNARAEELRRLRDFREVPAWTSRAGNDFFRVTDCVEKKLSLFWRLHAKIQRRAQFAKFQRLWWSFPVFVCAASRRARAQMFRETRKETFSRLKITQRSTRKQSSELCKKLAFSFVCICIQIRGQQSREIRSSTFCSRKALSFREMRC